MTTVPAPILDPSVALDSLLDARYPLAAIRDSTLSGQPLHAAMLTAINAVDGALAILRSTSGKAAA